jgi:hypothetical protein
MIRVGVQHTSTEQDRSISSAELVYAALDLRAEMTHEALDGPGSCITKGADCAAFDLFGKFKEHINLASVSAAFDEAVHHVHHPCSTFSAWCALTARLVFVKRGETRDRSDNVSAFVHDNDGTSTKTRLSIL